MKKYCNKCGHLIDKGIICRECYGADKSIMIYDIPWNVKNIAYYNNVAKMVCEAVGGEGFKILEAVKKEEDKEIKIVFEFRVDRRRLYGHLRFELQGLLYVGAEAHDKVWGYGMGNEVGGNVMGTVGKDGSWDSFIPEAISTMLESIEEVGKI